DVWLPELERLLMGFGGRLAPASFPPAVFAQPLGTMHIAVVQAAATLDARGTVFHVLVCGRPDYEQFLGDPFALARRFPMDSEQNATLSTLALPRTPG